MVAILKSVRVRPGGPKTAHALEMLKKVRIIGSSKK